MAKEENEEKQKDEVELTSVVTQRAPAIKLPGIEEPVTMEEFFVWMGNQIYEIKKNTG